MNRETASNRLGALSILAAIAAISWTGVTQATEMGWPREVDHPKAEIVVYQPQFDAYDGARVEGRAAVSVTAMGAKKPVFGAVWLEATADVDRDDRIVTFHDIKVPRVRFPDASPEQEQELTAVIENAAPQWDNTMSYDRFLAGVAAIAGAKEAIEKLRNDPPRIVFENEPAMLLLYDGEPQLRDVKGTKLRRVINTPSVVILDPAVDRYYLYGGTAWLEARDPLGPWGPGKPTAEVAALGAQLETSATEAAHKTGDVLPQEDENELVAEAETENPSRDSTKPPKVVTATAPTELIVFEGKPDYAPLVEADLLYVRNTASDVLLETASQRRYVLISGRWYRSKSLDGPWEFVRGDQLPESFKLIAEDSAKGHLLAAVAGTPQAEEAVADAAIPQVAEVKRGPAELEILYDGEPKFEKISGTSVERAVNTPSQILRIDGKYYACDQGIWYTGSAASGPWQVADSVPEEVQQIPPESPAYNVKYVYVYDSTPEVVYVGYTTPYLGCYPYHGTVVWGTGYPYAPWIGSVYYPRPVTWGFHAHYNPYYGWSFGVSAGWSFGWGSITIGWSNWGGHGYHPPYWGPGGYYPPYRPPYYPPRYPPHYPGRPVAAPMPAQQPAGRPGTVASTLPAEMPTGRPSNLYERPANQDRVATTHERPRPELATRPSTREGKNNVYADSGGNIYRRTEGGRWEERIGDSWKKTPRPETRPKASTPGAGARPSKPSAGTRPSKPSTGARPTPRTPSPPPQSLNRDYSSRQRGSSMSRGYGGGGRGARPRGGGRRR